MEEDSQTGTGTDEIKISKAMMECSNETNDAFLINQRGVVRFIESAVNQNKLFPSNHQDALNRVEWLECHWAAVPAMVSYRSDERSHPHLK